MEDTQILNSELDFFQNVFAQMRCYFFNIYENEKIRFMDLSETNLKMPL